MRVLLILPALTEATSPFFRPIKYSLFPPLGLATLAAYLDPGDTATILDEHVEPAVDPDDVVWDDLDLVVIQTYITNAYRAYRIADAFRARGKFVAIGGASRDKHARRGVTTLGCGLSWARGGDLPAIYRRAAVGGRLSRECVGFKKVREKPCRGAADPPRPDTAFTVSGAELDRGEPWVSAPLHVLLQGCVL